jgi:hypothetical protein
VKEYNFSLAKEYDHQQLIVIIDTLSERQKTSTMPKRKPLFLTSFLQNASKNLPLGS